MRPIRSPAVSLIITVALLFGLGFLASQVATSEEDTTRPSQKPEPVRSTESSDLLIDIVDVRNDQGNVVVAVFDEEGPFKKYDYDLASAYAEIPARAGTIQAHFAELSEGPDAVSLFHDENNDSELNCDGLYPLEGYGTSGTRDSYHEPTFEEASVDPGRVAVNVYYLR